MLFGAVFWTEWRRLTRRWQFFAARSLFIALLMAAFTFVWFSHFRGGQVLSLKDCAQVGDKFFEALIAVQLTVFLFAAPAATAGAICHDKVRGALFPLLLTRLSAWDIVAGRLATRLLPALGLVACGIPFLFLVLFFGGIDPETVAAAALVLFAVAVFGAALALLLSVWATRTHEVLCAVILFWTVVLLLEPVWDAANHYLQLGNPHFWLTRLNPYALVFDFGPTRGGIGWRDIFCFSAGALLLSLVLVLLATGRLRAVILAQASRPAGDSRRRRLARFFRRCIPGPSLARSPLLWREWYARRSSRWLRIVWSAYFLLGAIFTLEGIREAFAGGWFNLLLLAIVSAAVVFVGLLFVAVAAVSSLVEEWSTSSIDILLTTLLTPTKLLGAKWLGTFRLVPLVVVLPCAGAIAVGWIERSWGGLPILVALVLAYGAAFTSWGLFLATCNRKPGRALAWTVSSYIALCLAAAFGILLSGLSSDMERALAPASPLLGGALVTVDSSKEEWIVEWQCAWIAVYSILALTLFIISVRTVNHRRGRSSP